MHLQVHCMQSKAGQSVKKLFLMLLQSTLVILFRVYTHIRVQWTNVFSPIGIITVYMSG